MILKTLKSYQDSENEISFKLSEQTLASSHIVYIVSHCIGDGEKNEYVKTAFSSYLDALEAFTNKLLDYLNNEEESEDDSILIQDLDLSARAANCLLRAGLRTLSDLKDLTKFQLRRIRNLGVKSLEEIEEVVKEHGYELKEI